MVALPTQLGPYLPYSPAPGLWEGQADVMCRSLLDQTVYGQTEDYRKTQEELHDFCDGAHAELMRAHFAITHPEVAAKFWNQSGGAWHRYLNIVDLLTRTLSVIFHRAPDLYLMRGGVRLPSDSPEAVEWEKDLVDVKFASVLRQWDKLTTLLRTTFLEVDAANGKMRWSVRPPYVVRVVQGHYDPSDLLDARAVNVELPIPSDSPGHSAGQRWMTWTQERNQNGTTRWGAYYWDGTGTSFQNPVNSANVNPYGMFPFVCLRDAQPAPGEFYLPPRDPWLKSQYWVNRMLTDEGWGLHWGTHPTRVVNGWQEDTPPVMDPAAQLWSTNSERIEVDYSQPPLNLEIAERILVGHLQQLSIAEGLPADFWTGDGSTRNLGALKMQAHYLQMRREDRIPLYREAITELWNVHRRVKNVTSGRTVYGPDLTIGVELKPVPYPTDETAHTNAVVAQIGMGLTNPIEVLQQERGLSFADAQRVYERNLEINAKLRPPAVDAQPGPTPITPPDARE